MSDKQYKWYTLRVISGQERKLSGYLISEITRSKWTEIIPQLIVPTQTVFQQRAGKRVKKDRNMYPGYIFVQALEGCLDADKIQAFRSYTGVIGFIGKMNPIAMRDDEANKMLGKIDEAKEASDTMSEPFVVGETIKITDGPFNDFDGLIEEIYEEKKKLKVIVKIFGRRTPVELNFMQVEKIA